MLTRLVANAAALAAATALLPGITLEGASTSQRAVTLLVVALVFGVLNAFVKPLVKLLTLPLVWLTLGLFLLVINAALLLVTSRITLALGHPFHVAGLPDAVLGSIIISIVSALVGGVLGRDDK